MLNKEPLLGFSARKPILYFTLDAVGFGFDQGIWLEE